MERRLLGGLQATASEKIRQVISECINIDGKSSISQKLEDVEMETVHDTDPTLTSSDGEIEMICDSKEEARGVEISCFFHYQKSNLYSFKIGKSLEKIAQFDNLFLCKVVPISRVACLLIGGANDV